MINYAIYTLLVLPIVAAIIMLFFKDGKARKFFVYLFAGAIALISIGTVALYIVDGTQQFNVANETAWPVIKEIISFAGLIAGAVGLFWAIRYKKPLAIVLTAIGLLGSIYFDFFVAKDISVINNFYIDEFSAIMIFIIGVIGSGIIIYALGYMTDFNKHLKEGEKDRSNHFFMLMFLFLSAMFLIVISNNMTFMYTGWEITTICSFLLIGYTRTEEAINNSIRQIVMNVLGGIAFLIAIYLSATNLKTLELDTFISSGLTNQALVSLPLCLLAFAGITKAAQMPFHSWLLGAMVAPTPTSALLHSSTMVKAGVFLLVKLAPLFYICQYPKIMVMLVGGITFLLCSCMAISQTNAKRVLAFSTIANLGLITACAGVGTPEAIWAAIMLIIFHACAKSLMFLCVGTADHHINSLDIEDMDGLFVAMPRLARYMMVGIMAMFVAPFGMLVSKWAALVSFVDSGQIVLILLLAFGSAATFVFWAKWLGKLAGVINNKPNIEKTVHKSEWISSTTMLVLTILMMVALPVLSIMLVSPYLVEVFTLLGNLGVNLLVPVISTVWDSFITYDTMIICILSLIVVLIILFAGVGKKNKSKKAEIYLAGANVDSDSRTYVASMGQTKQATAKNLYLIKYFGDKKLSPIGSVLCIVIFVLAFAASAAFMLGLL